MHLNITLLVVVNKLLFLETRGQALIITALIVKYIHGFPPGYKPREKRFAATATQSTQGNLDTSPSDAKLDTFYMEQYNHLLTLLNKQPLSSTSPSTEEDSTSSHALAGKHCFLSCLNIKWLLDSGPSDHIYNNLSWFQSYDVVIGPQHTSLFQMLPMFL